MSKDILIKGLGQIKTLVDKKFLLSVLIGFLTLLSFSISGLAAPYAGLMIALGTLGLLWAALNFSLEFFLALSVFSIALLGIRPYHPVITICYGCYVFFPLLIINFYKKYALALNKKEAKKDISVFYLLNAFMNFITFLLCIFWHHVLQAYPLPHTWYSMLLPGFFSWQMSAFFGIFLICWASKAKYPITYSFQLTSFDYWWIVLCQMGGLLFQGEDQFLFYNMLMCSFLPFMMYGLCQIEKYIRKNSVWVASFLGILSILSAFPVICVVLYALFQPWISREDSNGNC